MKKIRRNSIMHLALVGGFLVAAILLAGTFWMGRSAADATNRAVRSVSLLYLDELAGRREQVVASNLQTNIRNIQAALALLGPDDLRDEEHLQAFQARMKQLYELERFAFVDENGLIHTSEGTRTDIGEYAFDYRNLSKPEISLKNLTAGDCRVVIAVPVKDLAFESGRLTVCFMEISMERMLTGVSMLTQTNGATFCNLYTKDGFALSNLVLGGLAREDNLLVAMGRADFEEDYSQEQMKDDFENGRQGVVSFTYNEIRETLAYVPVEGTDWFLTYLIRESVISDKIRYISDGIIRRSLIQSVLTAAVLIGLFVLIISETRNTAKVTLAKETAEAEARARQEELESRLALQEQLLLQEKQRVQQDSMITALASDYRSVYFVDLDKDEGICYRADTSVASAKAVGERFPFRETLRKYAEDYVQENYRQEFIDLLDPETIRENLKKERVLSLRYQVVRDGKESYEMFRIAGVGTDDSEDGVLHGVGVGFTDIDAQMRETMAKNRALSDALHAAEESNKAKTAFLSNMSHEIRTPMNAIIGIDSIALSDPTISESTRGYLEKIGSSAEHLLGLINDILDMSRIESGHTTLKNEEFSFSKFIEQVNVIFSGQCQDKGLEYHCRVKGQLDDYYIGDDGKLRQVLINILGNAVKFTPEGGRVEFEVERTAQYDSRSVLSFTVRDTGIGMSADFLPHIFDTFSQEDSSTTSRYGSSGLGLAITKNLVEMMNGKIEVESEKGKGSTFTVTVTLLNSDREAGGEEPVIRPEEMKVLVIDDDPIACEHAALVLGREGIGTETAESGEKALEMVRLRHLRRDPYNLILVDWKMPEMDGVETARRIRELVGGESAIIILTAYKWDEIEEEAEEAGIDGFLAKPLFAANVVEQFGKALRRKKEDDAPKADLKGRRILLAEDVDINAEIMTMVLQMREMEVEHAENGRIAVEMFSEKPDGYYDAVLMDMRMPEMDGLQATETIRAMDRSDAKTIPIIALTANAFDEDVQRSLQAGLNAHLSKPVEPETLYSALESLIRV